MGLTEDKVHLILKLTELKRLSERVHSSLLKDIKSEEEIIEEMQTSLEVLQKTAVKFKEFKKHFIEQGGKSASQMSCRHSRQKSLDSSRHLSTATISQTKTAVGNVQPSFNSPIKKEDVDTSQRKQSDMMIRLQKTNLNIYENLPSKPKHRRICSENSQYILQPDRSFNADYFFKPEQAERLAPNSGKYVRYQNSVKLNTERLKLNENTNPRDESLTSRWHLHNFSHLDPTPTRRTLQNTSISLSKTARPVDISAFNLMVDLSLDKHLRRGLASRLAEAPHPVPNAEQSSSPGLEESTWNKYYTKHIKNYCKQLNASCHVPGQIKTRRLDRSSIDQDTSKTSIILNQVTSGSTCTPKNSKLFLSKRKRGTGVIETHQRIAL